MSGYEPATCCARCGCELSLADAMNALDGAEPLCEGCRAASDDVAEAERELAQAEAQEERAHDRLIRASRKLEAARERARQLASVEVPTAEEAEGENA